MPLESAPFINGLDPANPAGTDLIQDADNHLRLIKSAVKATFPNLTEAVTTTAAQLNLVPSLVPIGLITVWYGSTGAVPSGWAICNGQTVTRSDGEGSITTPDLRDRTVIGAGTIAAQGSTVGATTSSVNTGQAGAHSHTIAGGAHTHTGTVGDTALTIAQMPAHNHGNGVTDQSGNQIFPYGSKASPTTLDHVENGGSDGSTQGLTETVGGGQTHTHSLTIDSATHTHTASDAADHYHTVSVSTVQPSMGLHYIMKH